MIDEANARAWCHMLARTCHVQHISPDGTPYLDRYFIAGWNPITRKPGPSIFLHHFLGSDPNGEVHSHPWGFAIALILVGGYREERCIDGRRVVRDYGPGDVNVILANDQHRIDLLSADVWTLFVAGLVAQAWRFAPLCP